MKPKNFPAKKNTRRLSVLDKLNRKKDKSETDKKEIKTLEGRIMDNQDALTIKTKKDRANKSKK
jgi:hypothetical protein